MIPMNILTNIFNGNRAESREMFEKIKELDYIQGQNTEIKTEIKPELDLYRIKKYHFSKAKVKAK